MSASPPAFASPPAIASIDSRADFVEAATALLGPKGFTADPETMAPWLTDWRGRFTGRALAMASPASTAEVGALIKLCGAHGVPIVPQGGNSGMAGGATPDTSGAALLLSLRRMNAIRLIDGASRTAVCEAGVILQVLHEAAAQEKLRFPLSLGGKGSATIGGLISTNAGGTQVLRHGSMRALVLGLEAVMADGAVFDQLTVLKKDNRGFDLKQLLIGSEGTIGVVTAATLKLEPAIAAREVLWAGLESLEAARELLLHVQRHAGGALEGFEVLPAHSLDAVCRFLPGARPPLAGEHAWHALIELVADADGAEALPALAERLLETAFEGGLIGDATLAATETQAEAFWALRDAIAPAERMLGPAVQHDVSVPTEHMPAFVGRAVREVEAAWPGTKAIGFGHLGDGNIHFHVIAPPGVDPAQWQEADGKMISRQVHDILAHYAGSISAEHGIGQLKRDELARTGDPVALAILRRVKQALDPQMLLNPGKLV
ncbi:FAD-binding oxidoreductase [Novosphingobium sp. Chol11]|uniref:FAD-binding oxidoreductase n=1 Tax=Novosphingobium sp. Chol11 TaxID=1385763 RepID=UPI0025F736E7|nr:FAD-binding oxidoreductase [Novosphingobium sp. Chol11]